ncbi:nicotinate-nucleotide adenylyltransferase [Chloroflexota bacterium]
MGVVRVVKIGILGGTFDPIHRGHLMVAEEVRARLSLAEVLFVPAGRPCLKDGGGLSAPEHRLKMVHLAIGGNPYYRVSTVEIERVGPSYTVDTMAELKGRFGSEDELFFILGWDNLAQLPRWREPSRLVELCRLVAVPRPGYPRPDLGALEGLIPGLATRVVLMDRPQVDTSASDIRGRIMRGQAVSHLVAEPVEEYIREHGLYKTAVA